MARKMSELIPSIEQRLTGWVAIHERQQVGAKAPARPTVTLSREFGCEGFALATRLKELLDDSFGEPWTVFDQLLIEKVAQDEDIALRILRNLGDVPRAVEALGLHPKGVSDSQDVLFKKVVRFLVPIAKGGNAIIVGRGGALLCQGLPNCFHFRLVASLEWRVRSYARRMEMPLDEAGRVVKELSEMRDRFLGENLGADVADPKYYDAIYSNERHSADDMARAIVAYVKAAWADRLRAPGGGGEGVRA